MKYDLVYNDEKSFPFEIGTSLGTIYLVDESLNIKLKNYGYNYVSQNFYYNRDIKLPKKTIKYFESSKFDSNIEKEMNSFGITSFEETAKLIMQYEKLNRKKEILKEKIKKNSKIINLHKLGK